MAYSKGWAWRKKGWTLSCISEQTFILWHKHTSALLLHNLFLFASHATSSPWGKLPINWTRSVGFSTSWIWWSLKFAGGYEITMARNQPTYFRTVFPTWSSLDLFSFGHVFGHLMGAFVQFLGSHKERLPLSSFSIFLQLPFYHKLECYLQVSHPWTNQVLMSFSDATETDILCTNTHINIRSSLLIPLIKAFKI